MIIEHKILKLIDYSIVDITPFKTKPSNVKHSAVLSFKLNGKIYSAYTPINYKNKELNYIDLLDCNFLEDTFFYDKRLILPAELKASPGITSEDLIKLNSSLIKNIEGEITIDQYALHYFMYKETEQLWNEYTNKTLQLRTDLHDFHDFVLFSDIENYRIRNNLSTTSAAMKELIKNAVAMDSLNVIIENNKLFQKEYL